MEFSHSKKSRTAKTEVSLLIYTSCSARCNQLNYQSLYNVKSAAEPRRFLCIVRTYISYIYIISTEIGASPYLRNKKTN